MRFPFHPTPLKFIAIRVGETVRLNESSPNTKERSTRRVRASRSNQKRKSIEINSDDLITHHWSEQLVFALLSWALGYVGSFFIWLGLAIRYPIFAEWLYTLLVFEIVGSALFALLAALREELLRKIAKQGFVFTFFLEKGIFWAYYGAFLIALYPLLSLKGAIPEISPLLPVYSSLPIISVGLFFFLIIPRYALSRLLWEIRESRLCILQFSAEWATGTPRYFWLRFGMRGVEQGLRRSGLSLKPGVLYHGASYCLFRESLSLSDLNAMAEWLIQPTRFRQVNSTISGLIWASSEAEGSGFGRVYGILGRILQLPWPRAYSVFVAISVIAGSIPPIAYLIKWILSLP